MNIDADKIYKLKGVIQHYAWGGAVHLPQLLGLENQEQKPFAEYWMGAHSSAPSMLLDEGNEVGDLRKIFSEQEALLGNHGHIHFNELPYLLKILDVKEMLSIQVHPTKAQAEKGYEEEEARGVPINAYNRNYKDQNHKPEVMLALSDFWLLHGFKPETELIQTIQSIPEFESLLPIFNNGNYKTLYSYVMAMPQQQVDQMLGSVIKREIENCSKGNLQKADAGWWVSEYYQKKEIANIDKGIFSIYFFNIVYLEKGQGIFQAPGIPHAYLAGQNVELMANSDNVLRAGLTPKYVDVTELIKHTRFEAVHPVIMHGEQQGVYKNFNCSVKDFAISSIELLKEERFYSKSQSPEMFICLEGSGSVSCSNKIDIAKGEAFIIFPGNNYAIKANDGLVLYKAGVPV